MRIRPFALTLAALLAWLPDARAHHTAPSGFAGQALSQSSIHWSWSDSTEPDEVYRVLDENGANLSGDLPAGTSGWTETGLAPGADYTRRVVSFASDHEGSSGQATAGTLPADPILTAPSGFNGSPQDPSTIVWSWSGAENEIGYRVETSGGAPVSGDLPAGTLSWTEGGLSPATSYTRRVTAFNASSQASSGEASATTPAPPEPTLTGPPNFDGQTLGPGSLRWTWSDVDGETGYRVEDPDGNDLSGSLPSGRVFWEESGLAPQTTYTRRVVAFNSASLAPSAFDSASTSADDDLDEPDDFRGQGISSGAILWTWDDVDNELGYRVVDMDDASVSGDLPPGTAAWTENGLSPDTAYRRRVVAFNASRERRSNADTARTLPGPPVPAPPTAPQNFGAVAVTEDSLTWGWSDSIGEDGYRVETPEGAAVSVDLPAGSTLFTETGLGPNAAFSRRVTAFNEDGSASSQAASRRTLAAAPAGASLEALDYFTLRADWSANGNPAGTVFRAELLRDGSLFMSREGPDAEAVFAGLPPDTVFSLRVSAVNGDGVRTAAATAAGATPPVPSNYVDPASGRVLDFFLPSGLVTVSVPPGAFAQPVLLSLREAPAAPAGPSPGSRLSPTGVGFEILLDKPLQPVRPLALAVTYRDFDDPGLPEAELTLARYDPVDGRWVPLVTRVDAAANRAEAETGHLSLFHLMRLAPSASVAAAVVFPNPFQPSKGHRAVQFDRLPVGARVRVYTLAGELVRELTADATGAATWERPDPASGVYFIHLEDEGGKHVMKMVIQR
jgi:hypothetical protein